MSKFFFVKNLYINDPPAVRLKAPILFYTNFFGGFLFFAAALMTYRQSYGRMNAWFFLFDGLVLLTGAYLLLKKKYKISYYMLFGVFIIIFLKSVFFADVYNIKTFFLLIFGVLSVEILGIAFIEKPLHFAGFIFFFVTLVIYYFIFKLIPEIDFDFSNRRVLIAAGFSFVFTETFIVLLWFVFHHTLSDLTFLNRKLDKKVLEKTRALADTVMELEQTRDYLIETEKLSSLGRMASGIAHEVNTPLGVSITGVSHLSNETGNILQKYRCNALTQSDFSGYLAACADTQKLVLKNLKRAAKLIRGFKDLSVEQTSEEKRVFNIKDSLTEIIESMRYKYKNHVNNISVKCSADLTMNSYPGFLVQIFSNLLDNVSCHAFPAPTKGDVFLEVREIHENHNLFVEFVFKDNGVGIEKEHLSQIYEPFFTTKRGRGGSGLGLNIVYNLVKNRLKGTISCESSPGNGTSFKIVLPKERQ